ncbi:hypothetical protein [Methylocaldum sp. GT1TLB]|uniref:hypothetical protein n=1 Tax=Methylocaldum sp. GT1TLB TaxID=3438965 RepID=UPI003DA0C036
MDTSPINLGIRSAMNLWARPAIACASRNAARNRAADEKTLDRTRIACFGLKD